MKKTLLPLVLCLPLYFYAQDFEWAKTFGGGANDLGRSVAVDASGNVYTTGYFIGTVDFDPGAGTTNLTSSLGGPDVFVQKLDASGNFLWAKSYGGNGGDSGQSITIDGSGDVYITGYFQGTVDFDPGSGTTNLTSVGGNDIFIQKLNASGNLLWVKSFGGSDDENGYSITIDASGNAYTTGYYRGTVDFDPGPGTNIFTSVGGNDIFVQKLDATGNFIWAKSFGGSSSDYGRSVRVDASGNVYTSGWFQATVDFNPGAGTTNLTSLGGADVFIQKLDASGNFLWTRSFGGSANDFGLSIALDVSGNVYTTGYYSGTVDFDPGTGTSNHTPVGGSDIFIQKLDASGNFLWARSFGGSANDYGISITLDTSGNAYTTGWFDSTVDFDPGSGTTNLTSVGGSDVFVQKLNASGNFLWAKSFGGSVSDIGQCITVDASENVYTIGFYEGTADFDPGVGISNHTSAGNLDVFVQKLNQCATTTGTDVQTACDSYTWIDGNTYTTSNNTATHTLTNAAGCDSIVTLDLTINNSTTGIDIQTACDSYSWIDGNTYTSSNNTATHTLTNAAGCDSIVTLDLTITNSTTGTDVQTACDSYTWIDGNTYTASNNTATHTLTNVAGCDSIVTLDLTITNSTTGTDLQTACDSYTWIDGNTYTTSNNTATHTLTNAAGCDSVVTLDLTINNSTTGTDVQTACDSYTWIDGNTYTASNNTATHTLTNVAGCDSIVTLDLTITNSTTGADVQTACDSYTWIDGNTYTTSNSTATHTLTNAVGCDSLVTLDLTITNSTSGTDVQTACDSYTWIDGNTYTASNNTATHTLTNAAGCDSIVTLDLTITNSTTGTDLQTACDSYTWIDGNTYIASNNTATHTLTNAAGCDSVVTLDLTITNSTTGTDVQTACDSYTWIDGNAYTTSNNTATHTLTNAEGCDSIVTLDLTITNSTTGTDVQTACDSYTWIDGNTYTTSNNTATHTLTNAAGCDSIVTLDLTINTVDAGISQIDDETLTANLNGANYQWLDCDDNYAPIAGETGQTFVALTNGNYAVEVTGVDCTDTSACIVLDAVSLNESFLANAVELFPNPTESKVSIRLNDIKVVKLVLTDAKGQRLESTVINQDEILLDLSNYSTGVYFIHLESDQGTMIKRLIKK